MTTKPKTARSANLAKSESTTLPADPGAGQTKPAPVPGQHDTQLIPVTEGEIGGVKCLVVDAKSLHQTLGVGRDFTTWIKHRIESYGFSESEDYENVISPSLGNQNLQVNGGDRKSRQYSLTLDMAKELAMVEKNAVGRAVRRYFIQCEKELLKQLAQPQKALPIKKDEKNSLKDWSGKPYEEHPIQSYMIELTSLLVDSPRKAAYVEYARSLAIIGASKKAVAEEMAEGAYDKALSANLRKFLDHKDMFPDLDLNKIKSVLERKDLI